MFIVILESQFFKACFAYNVINVLFSYVAIHPFKMYRIMKTRIRIRFVYKHLIDMLQG